MASCERSQVGLDELAERLAGILVNSAKQVETKRILMPVLNSDRLSEIRKRGVGWWAADSVPVDGEVLTLVWIDEARTIFDFIKFRRLC